LSDMQSLCYALLLVAAGGAIAFDWIVLGPLLALRNGAAAIVCCFVLLVPFGAVLESCIRLVWFVAICGLGLIGTALICQKGEPPISWILGFASVVFCFWLAFHGDTFEVVENAASVVLLFLAVYWLMRSFTDVAAGVIRPIARWPELVLVDKDSSEHKGKLDAFEAGCAAYAHKYKFWLQIVNLYRVTESAKHAMRSPLTRTADGQHLFHGTKRQSARGILQNGFQLPSHPGMFGKGLYFADCPLKSWQYTDGHMRLRNGVILMCWVELGRPSHQKAARNNLTRPPRRSFMQWVRGEAKYTSVVGDTHDAGGALRVPEYIVYEPTKVQVDYVFEVRCVPPGTPPEDPPPEDPHA